jgi:hypothetical protein
MDNHRTRRTGEARAMSGPQLPEFEGSQSLGAVRHELKRALIAAHVAAYRELYGSRNPSEQLRCAESVLRLMATWAVSRL